MANQRKPGWNPKRTLVFVVGTLEWKHSDYFESFPKENRRDEMLVELFRAQGVPDERIVYLQDRQATTRRIQQSLEALLETADSGDLLVLYYTGHGGKDDDGTIYFASYDTNCETNRGWVVDTIPETIERCFGGSHALLLIDCCYSGTLAEVVAQQEGEISYACLTSSLSSELSTGNWTFTEGVLAGFGGQAFVDGDGNNAITLSELAGQIGDSMAFAEEQIVTFATTGDFDPHMVLANARPRSDNRIGKQVGVYSEDDWYRAQIIAVANTRFKVHYYGFEEDDDEWVTSDLIREITRPTYSIGATVAVKRKRTWYPATVRDVRAGIHYIEYEDQGPEWNEWVALNRMRPIA